MHCLDILHKINKFFMKQWNDVKASNRDCMQVFLGKLLKRKAPLELRLRWTSFIIRQSTHTAKKLGTTSLFSSTLKGNVHKRVIKIAQQECKRRRTMRTARAKTALGCGCWRSADCRVQPISGTNSPFSTFYHLSWKTVN